MNDPDGFYQAGVWEALCGLTFEEANACGFPDPYTAVTKFEESPLGRLFARRKQRLLEVD